MNIQFLGTGGAFDVEFGNSSAVVNIDNENILIDCGFSIFPKLVSTGTVNQINKILITHLHDDHVGGLSSLILYYYFKLNLGRLKILYPTDALKKEIINFLKCTTGNPEKYVEFINLKEVNNIQYIDTTGQHIENMLSYGYVFLNKKESIIYSGDIANSDTIFGWLTKNRIQNPIVFHDVSFTHDGVHTFYKDLIPYVKDYKVFGYHCNPNKNPKDNPIPLVINEEKYIWKQEKWYSYRKDIEFLVTKSA